MESQSEKIRAQNDAFRKNPTGSDIPGQMVMTPSIANYGVAKKLLLLKRVFEYNDFLNDDHKNAANDEHNFGSFEIDDVMVYWKIDYYDVNFEYGSEDPTDLSKTRRVLTVMEAAEY